MRITQSDKYKMVDVLIPQAFLADFLPNLSGDAVRLYLWLCYIAHDCAEFAEESIVEALGLDKRTYIDAKRTLLEQKLIAYDQYKITLTDLRSERAKVTLKHGAAKDERRIIEPAVLEQREQLIKEINRDFYAGSMPPAIYRVMLDIFEKFEFELAVIPLIFTICRNNKNENAPRYIQTVAQDWHENYGVRTYQQAAERLQTSEKVSQLQAFVTKQMNWHNLSKYATDIIQRWYVDFEGDTSVVAYALSLTTGAVNPSPKYVDKILQRWSDAGLRKLPEIKEYENNRRKSSRRQPNTLDTLETARQSEEIPYDLIGFELIEPVQDKTKTGDNMDATASEATKLSRNRGYDET